MKITVKRLHYKDESFKELVLSDFDGVLYEYNGFQFCIGLYDDAWAAIELQTGHSAETYYKEVNDKPHYCTKKVLLGLELRTKEEFIQAINHLKIFIESQGFTFPINEKIIVDENKNS